MKIFDDSSRPLGSEDVFLVVRANTSRDAHGLPHSRFRWYVRRAFSYVFRALRATNFENFTLFFGVSLDRFPIDRFVCKSSSSGPAAIASLFWEILLV
jgi:hypothetical protein